MHRSVYIRFSWGSGESSCAYIYASHVETINNFADDDCVGKTGLGARACAVTGLSRCKLHPTQCAVLVLGRPSRCYKEVADRVKEGWLVGSCMYCLGGFLSSLHLFIVIWMRAGFPEAKHWSC